MAERHMSGAACRSRRLWHGSNPTTKRDARRSPCRVRECQWDDARTQPDDATLRSNFWRLRPGIMPAPIAAAVAHFGEGCNGTGETGGCKLRHYPSLAKVGIGIRKTPVLRSTIHTLPAATSGGSNDFKYFLEFNYSPDTFGFDAENQ